MYYWVVVLVALSLGCSDKGQSIEPPPNRPDGGSSSAPHSCADSTDLLSDIYHCGKCDNRCSPSNADSCVNGECRCGPDDACGSGSDCRFSRCVPVDPEGKVCEFDGECAAGFACIEGRCSQVNCVPEQCDGFDNDCDGVVDGTADGPLARWCYSGPDGVVDILPPCKAGAQLCSGGFWGECLGEVPPYSELGTLACDHRDNNCDGCPDGDMIDGECVPLVVSGFDVVFLLDTSGSMRSKFSMVIESTRLFASEFSSDPFRFSLVEVPGEELPPQATVYIDFVGFSDFMVALEDVPYDGGASEPTYDAVYEAATNELGLSYREDSIRIIILFTDEEAQSYRSVRGLPGVDEEVMCDSLVRGEVLAVVTQSTHHDDYDECAEVFRWAITAGEMASTLGTIISDPCSSL